MEALHFHLQQLPVRALAFKLYFCNLCEKKLAFSNVNFLTTHMQCLTHE